MHRHALQHIRGADEFQNERGLRIRVDFLRGSDLKYLAVAHDRDPVGDRECLALIMGDDDGRDSELSQQDRQFHLHLFPEVLVESAQGLIEK